MAQIGKTHFRINTRNRGGVIGASRGEQLFRDRSDWFLSTLVPPCSHSLAAAAREEVDLEKGAFGSERKAKMAEDGQYYGKHGNYVLFYINCLCVCVLSEV